MKYYREALVLAKKGNMDPFGDQYFGIRLRIANLFEKAELVSKAIEVLESDRGQYMKAIEALSTRPDQGKRRSQLLFKAIALHVKLAEFYSHEQIHNDEAAEERLVWAATTILTERERRRNEDVKEDDEGEWINDEQTGATFEGMWVHCQTFQLQKWAPIPEVYEVADPILQQHWQTSMNLKTATISPHRFTFKHLATHRRCPVMA